jgi:hypothetical protein
VICTNCNARIIRGQRYFRNKKGAHHSDCPSESSWIDDMVKRWFLSQNKNCPTCGCMAHCGTCESDMARISQLCRDMIAAHVRASSR